MATTAELLLLGSVEAAHRVGAGLLRLTRNNFVERPWGGVRIREFKGLCPLPDQVATTGMGLGESFEVAADDGDEEARLHPSLVRFDDGSSVPLPALISLHGTSLLGESFIRRFGPCFPLLPKVLDIRELLSVQGHPPGNTEAYVIIDADPGATIRLGFCRDMVGAALVEELEQGRREQQALVAALAPAVTAGELQALLGPWFADRAAGCAAVEAALWPLLAGTRTLEHAPARLAALKTVYWRMLDAMNTVPVHAGQVIHNATPRRLVAADRPRSAEVHALGNPECREILALEVRRPGPTFRAWDNVRFPVREVNVLAAIDALNLRATSVEEFVVDPVPVAGRDATWVSVDSPEFRIEHLRPERSRVARVEQGAPHTLHVLAGAVELESEAGAKLGCLERGESAIVPLGIGRYRVAALGAANEVLKVSLPDDGA
jgi:mannose-6-phosphate isomerase class I